jgi:DNA-nicking Smr family endonuclease
MRSNRAPDDDEARLFQEEMADVAPSPRPAVDGRSATQPRSAPLPRMTEADEQRVPGEALSGLVPMYADVETGEELSYRRSGVAEKIVRKLKRGEFRIDASIDLHALTADGARAALEHFLAQAVHEGARVLHIVHGKGYRSKSGQGPVLKPLVGQWLRGYGKVLAFTSARPEQGGTGAVFVLLQRR